LLNLVGNVFEGPRPFDAIKYYFWVVHG